jgi:hypothetical protein
VIALAVGGEKVFDSEAFSKSCSVGACDEGDVGVRAVAACALEVGFTHGGDSCFMGVECGEDACMFGDRCVDRILFPVGDRGKYLDFLKRVIFKLLEGVIYGCGACFIMGWVMDRDLGCGGWPHCGL